MLLSWLKRKIIAPTPQFLITVVLDLPYCDTVINCVPRSLIWLCANKCNPIDRYKVDKVIVQL